MDNALTKKLISGFVIFAVIMAALWFAWNLTTKPAQQAQTENKKVSIEIADTDHSTGKENSKVVLVEFSDFQCPACKAYNPLVKQLMEDYGKDITLVFKNFPLAQHNHAKVAAYAAEAAGKQNKFFEMGDILFDKQEEWSAQDDPTSFFVKYAQLLKLDVNKFKKDMTSDEIKKKVDNDVLAGTQAGVDATPSFFLNGVKLSNPNSYQEFSALVTAELAKVEPDSKDSSNSAQTTIVLTPAPTAKK